MFTPDICTKIKHLAVDFDMWTTYEPLKANPLQKFTNLTDFTIGIYDAGCMTTGIWEPEWEKAD
ncbi:uncharacterized protein RSE6_02611 [Rhynchosporium secalis]|uniref:Uncharacterized protein n=1 Tax=Rhynchosporium secalis TaxID=38038 RepID=A0A1E1M0M4_RHYSE|nr:uncharacterized protein RSE6_02611 [Rhynchosporium secalis]